MYARPRRQRHPTLLRRASREGRGKSMRSCGLGMPCPMCCPWPRRGSPTFSGEKKLSGPTEQAVLCISLFNPKCKSLLLCPISQSHCHQTDATTLAGKKGKLFIRQMIFSSWFLETTYVHMHACTLMHTTLLCLTRGRQETATD